MVERIPKVDSDTLRILRKEDATDEHGGQGKPGQGEAEEHDEFSPKLDFKKWTGDKSQGAGPHPSLWDKRPAAQAGETADTAHEPEIAENPEWTVEEQTTSTTITFLRAAGILTPSGRPRWGTIALYTFALIGFLLTVTFVINALL